MFAAYSLVADLKESLKKIAGAVFLLAVMLMSVFIFLKRDEIGQTGGLSYPGIILVCFIANSTVFLPSPSLMFVASCALIMNPVLVALCGALGSSLGEIVGYGAGSVGSEIAPKFKSLTDYLKKKIKHDSWLVFLLALLPLPLFDVAGVYSGGSKMKIWKFFLLCFLGKFIKTMFYTQIYGIMNWLYTITPWKGV